MTPTVLPFPIRRPASAPTTASGTPAQIIRMEDHRKRVRPLRLATGVYFVTQAFCSPEDYTAA